MKIFFSILLIAFSIIISSEVVGIIFIYDSKVNLENQILNSAEEKNRMLVNRIDSYISERTIDMLNLVNDKSVLQAVVSSNAEFQKMDNSRQYIEAQNVTWSSTPQNVTTPFMSSIIENPTADRLRGMMSMEKAIFHNDVFGRLLLANSYGADVAGSIKPDDYDQLTDPWYVAAKQNGLYIGDVTLDRASGFIVIPIATRINDENGNFVGVAKGVLGIDNIFHILSDQMASQKIIPVEYELFDSKGTVLYSTNTVEKPLVNSFPNDFIQNIQGQSGSFIYAAPGESQHFVVYASSNSSKITPTGNWILATEYDPAQILQPVNSLTSMLLIMMIVMIPVTCVVVLLISRRIERPLADLMFYMRNFSKGDTKYVVPQGSDDVKELTSGFNNMMTSVRKSEEKILHSEVRYRSLFESSPDPIRLVNLDGIVTDVNQAFVRKFGYSKEESIGQPLLATLVETNSYNMGKIFEELKKGNAIYSMHVQYKKKDGSIFPALLSATPFYDSENLLAGYVGTIKDITELVEAKKQIEEKEAKIELQYAKLAQVDKQKDEFSSMVSHELTTPLFPIKFHAAMLKDPKNFGELNSDQLNSVNEIYQNSEKLEKLISDVLDAQKLEMGVTRFKKDNFAVDEFMNKIFTHNLPFMENKKIKFINSTKDKMTVTSDADRLSQVFSNLIMNSVDFVPVATGTIEINAEDQGKDVLFYVKDNGIGIPKDKQGNLFKKFYQIDTSPTRKHRGSGLGLSISKGIVEGLGGKIWLESAVGVGTVVYFTIPKANGIK
ncbi:MAG TPA: ATP-binding protein [Candidatus Nitrosotalea sp.]|nr:ATP-binding protein [Candidatus Nitrosotalea sp.]